MHPTFNNLFIGYIISLLEYSKDFIFENKLLIMTFIIYKLIDILSKKIDIKEYIYEGQDELCNNVKIVCFNLNDESIENFNNKKRRYKNLYYRFKIEVKNKTHFIVINRNEIEFFDKIRLIKWMMIEHILNKICKNRPKILPFFLVKVYIFPNPIFI